MEINIPLPTSYYIMSHGPFSPSVVAIQLLFHYIMEICVSSAIIISDSRSSIDSVRTSLSIHSFSISSHISLMYRFFWQWYLISLDSWYKSQYKFALLIHDSPCYIANTWRWWCNRFPCCFGDLSLLDVLDGFCISQGCINGYDGCLYIILQNTLSRFWSYCRYRRRFSDVLKS